GVAAVLDLSSEGSDTWWNAMLTMLSPLTRPRDFYDFMRDGSDSASWGSETLPVDWQTHLEIATRANPNDPALARAAGVDRVVRLRVLIGPDGLARQMRVIKGLEMLYEAARQSVRGSRFTPASWNGEAVWTWTTVDVRFSFD